MEPPPPSPVACPTCKFPNAPTAQVCLTCLGPLPPAETRSAPRPEGLAAPSQREQVPDPPTSRIKVPKQAEVRAWLWCDPLPPIPLSLGARVIIGRSAECDLTLPHSSISRQHAEVSQEEAELTFRDRGSYNGSYLNGKRVASAALRVGDVLTLGPYNVEVRGAPGAAGGVSPDGTQPLERCQTGLLTEVPLHETLQDLELRRRSGTLRLVSGDLRGSLCFVDGRPVSATLGDLRDDEAVIAMLDLADGRFILTDRAGAVERTMRASLTKLLLEHARRKDEAESP